MAKKKKKIISRCCFSETYKAPEYYQTKMEEVPLVDVCCNCGHKCSTLELTDHQLELTKQLPKKMHVSVPVGIGKSKIKNILWKNN